MIDTPPPFVCHVVKVHDADGPLWCRSGQRIRVAAINARETNGTCRRNAPCPTMRHAQARPIVERLVLRKALRCRQVGVSYKRVVAACRLPDGRDLGCTIVSTGAASWWPSYARRYGLGGCRGSDQ